MGDGLSPADTTGSGLGDRRSWVRIPPARPRTPQVGDLLLRELGARPLGVAAKSAERAAVTASSGNTVARDDPPDGGEDMPGGRQRRADRVESACPSAIVRQQRFDTAWPALVRAIDGRHRLEDGKR